ncbi:hypothetical protein ACFYYL_42760, partial [Actinomadura geliboluensis]|uniref:hypothetical protein n=1 Tax=Actinomadura geliboluensis TaxID=882440 RepID=UPI0036B8D31F
MSRSVARVAAILVIAVGSGAVVAVPPAMADIGADMRFVCDGATGTREVGLRIQAGAPTSGNVGEPLQLGTIKVDVGIPAALADEVAAKALGETSAPPVTGVAPAPAPAIAGVAQMRVAVDGPGRAQGSGWPAFALAAAPSSEDGTVHLTGSGVAPPLVPQASGGLSWVAGDLELNLVPSDAATKTEKAGVSLRCAAEKQTVLGTVRVRDGSQGPAPGGRSGISRQAATLAEGACKELSPPGVDPRYDFNPDPELMKIYDNPKMPDGLTPSHGSVPMCIKATGFFNIKKSGNAVPISTQSSLLRQVDSFGGDSFFGANYFEDRGYFVNQTEPVPGTVLGFGFMPTRAVAEAVQVRAPGAGKDAPVAGNYRFITLLDAFFTAPNVLEDTGIQVAAYVQVKADKAEVNGVPIDLGNKCTTGTAVLNAGAFMGNPKTGILDPIDGQTLISENFNIPERTRPASPGSSRTAGRVCPQSRHSTSP